MNDPLPPDAASPTERVAVSNRQDIAVDESGLADLAEQVLVGEGAPEGELSLSFVSSEEMQQLHAKYMQEAGPTDVLAFPMGEEGLLGDVVICPEEARRNDPDLEAELRLLVVHGTLHLLGHDHGDAATRREMWSRQERYSGVRLEDER